MWGALVEATEAMSEGPDVHWEESGDGPESLLLVVLRLPERTLRPVIERAAGALGGPMRRIGVVWPETSATTPITTLVEAGRRRLSDNCPAWILHVDSDTTVLEPWPLSGSSRSARGLLADEQG